MRLGITGGIGSGKTSVCKVFNVLGIPVFYTDLIASKLMESNPSIIRRINSIAGKNIYVDGFLDRPGLANLIFNDNDLLKKVNSLVHPLVFDAFMTWEKNQTSPYVIMEAAILFESGASELVDKTVTVVAPVKERVERVIHRNRITRDQVFERMKNQMDDEVRMQLSDYIIHNSENDMIIPAILTIHNEILQEINRSI